MRLTEEQVRKINEKERELKAALQRLRMADQKNDAFQDAWKDSLKHLVELTYFIGFLQATPEFLGSEIDKLMDEARKNMGDLSAGLGEGLKKGMGILGDMLENLGKDLKGK